MGHLRIAQYTKEPYLEEPYEEPNINDLTGLEKLKQEELIHYRKLEDVDYYNIAESRDKVQEIQERKKQYLKNNPEDFIIVGVNLFGLFWEYTNRATDEEKKIFELSGKGLYYELQQKYENAIEFYQEAYNLAIVIFREELDELIQTNGDGDYLHTKILKSRIGRCKYLMRRDKINKLESEAKELEKTNPKEAIKKYGELNEVNPGRKKYDKRIEIVKRNYEYNL